jgi:hypothetical protein
MQRMSKLRPAFGPSAVIVITAAVLGLVLFSLSVQPPYDDGADATQRMLGWVRAGLFTLGALAFVAGLVIALRGTGQPAAAIQQEPRAPKPLPAAFTLVALGRTPDDARAITDVASAGEAVQLLWAWTETYPDEHVVIFNEHAEPVAFRRPTVSPLRGVAW